MQTPKENDRSTPTEGPRSTNTSGEVGASANTIAPGVPDVEGDGSAIAAPRGDGSPSASENAKGAPGVAAAGGGVTFTVEGPERPHPAITEAVQPLPGKKRVAPARRGHMFRDTPDRTQKHTVLRREGAIPGVTIEEGGPGRGALRYEFDDKLVEGLGRIGANDREIAAMCGVSEEFVKELFRKNPAFRQCYDRGLAEVCQSLRRKQISLALRGNVKMLTWLGMQLLGQRNVARAELNKPGDGADGRPVVFTLTQGLDGDGQPNSTAEREENAAEEFSAAGGADRNKEDVLEVEELEPPMSAEPPHVTAQREANGR